MFKRFVAVGAALIVALSFSTVAFAADTTSSVRIGFPYFSYVNLRHGGTYVYQGSAGSMPISGIQAEVNDTSTVYTNIILDFWFGGQYSQSVSEGSSSISYKVPVVSGINLDADSSIVDGYIQERAREFAYNQNTGTGTLTSQRDDIYIDTTDYTGSFTVTDKQYTVTIPSSTEVVNIDNRGIDAGQYYITGFFDFPSGTFSDATPFENANLNVRVPSGTVNNPFDIQVVDYSYKSVATNQYDRIEFSMSIDINSTYNSASALQMVWSNLSGVNNKITRFSINTCGMALDDKPNGILGFTYTLGSWISGLKSGISSGFNRIASIIERQDNEHEQVASQGDSSGNSDAQSKISDIELYEADLNTQIDLSVQSIDFTVPSSYGGALSAVGYIFTSVFNTFGGYQVILTIPLILGIMLLLVGRGQAALGRILRQRHDV